MIISFSGGALNVAYHIGAYNRLKRSKLLNNEELIFAGTSSGSIMAVSCACNIDIERIFVSNLRFMNSSQAFCSIIRKILTKELPENAHILCNNKVKICMTRQNNLTPLYVSKFSSKSDVINAVIGSCFIPKMTSSNLKYIYNYKHDDGNIESVNVLDGSFSDFLPKGNIRISCIPLEIIKYFPTLTEKSSVTISLKSKLYENLYVMTVGKPEYYTTILTQGYLDMDNYLNSIMVQ
jgi:hypothetical protein